MEEFKTSEFEGLHRELNDDEKKGNIGKVISHIISALKAGWSLASAMNEMKSLQDLQDYKKKIIRLFNKLV